jgi:predicted methyltransferase
MEIAKGRYYIDINGQIVKIISNKLEPLNVWVALIDPITPDIINLIYIDDNGEEIPHGDTHLDKDITCSRCNGRCMVFVWNGPDDWVSYPCNTCNGIGFKLN